MIKNFKLPTVYALFIILAALALCSCRNRGPDIVRIDSVRGYVIGKERCNTNESKDYWLIDCTYGTKNPQIGDTLDLNGITYTNVLKTNGLYDELKIIGMKVTIEYINITPNKMTTTGCAILNPMTYSLKEIFIKNQGEIR
jgi:hypothetical protein